MVSPTAASIRWCSSTSKLSTVGNDVPGDGFSGREAVSRSPAFVVRELDIKKFSHTGEKNGGIGPGRRQAGLGGVKPSAHHPMRARVGLGPPPPLHRP